MTSLEQALIAITRSLEQLRVGYALVGGLAVSARAESRLTRDADLAVGVRSDAEAESLVRSLLDSGYRVVASIEQEQAGRLATVRLTTATTDHSVVTDLLFASSGIEREIVGTADRVELLPGVILPIATIGHLIAMKLLSRDDRHRPTDADDLVALSTVADDSDWQTAAEAVALIEDRGFNRGRDLRVALVELRSNPGTYRLSP